MRSDTVSGRIVKGFGELYTVLTDENERIDCLVRGSLKYAGIIPLVGDRVTIAPQENGNPAITDISERKNSLIRPPIANIDKLFIVAATRSPLPSLPAIDKLCCAACAKGIEPVIVINKTDIGNADEIAEIYGKSGIKVIKTCAKTKEGISELRSLTDGICAFAGASGVGKSSLLNALYPELSLITGNVSEKNQRGRHTTRTVELFETQNGYFADTPGFGLIDLEHFDFLRLDELASSFPEFAKYLPECRYTDCTHTKEEDCGILRAVKRGDIAASRHESYLEMYSTLKKKEEYR